MAKYFKIAALLSILVCFANAVYAQSNEQLVGTIKKYYSKREFGHCILYFEGKWYFVTAINPLYYNTSYDRYGKKKELDVKSKAREKNIEFFALNKIKKYPKYTFLPEDMTNVPDVVDAYNILKENHGQYYNMPQVGSVKVDISTEVSFFAKAISNDPDTSSQINTGSTIVGNTEKSSYTTTAANSVQMKENNDAVNSKSSQDSKSVTLVVYGIANNENEAIKVALRSAIEQAYGTFVSANAQIVNDELTKDEIVSVTSGNIENYSLISSDKDSDGKTSVSVKATVSIGKLLQFAQSKGATTELAGAAFAMNMKMRKLNKENEYQALCHMFDKMLKISELNLFDYELKTEDPKITQNDNSYGIKTIINVTPNENYTNLINIFKSTLNSLSLSENEQEEYRKTGDVYFNDFGFKGEYGPVGFSFTLRNDINVFSGKLIALRNNIWKSSISFRLSDNLGNSSEPIVEVWRESVLKCAWPLLYCEEENHEHYLYGIAPSEDSHDSNFVGGSSAFLKKSLILHDVFSSEKVLRILRSGIFRQGSGVVGMLDDFSNLIINPLSCLDLSGKTYPFYTYLFYKEDDISKLSSITVFPVNPSEVITIKDS